MPPNGLFGPGVALHETRHRAAVGRDGVLQSDAAREPASAAARSRRAADALDDHAEDDVVRVGVLPAFAGREWRLGVEQVREPVLAGPDLVGIRAEVLRELRVELVAHDPAGVRHQMAHGDLRGVREPREPRLLAEELVERVVEAELLLVDHLQRDGRDVGLADAAEQQPVGRLHRRAGASGRRRRPPARSSCRPRARTPRCLRESSPPCAALRTSPGAAAGAGRDAAADAGCCAVPSGTAVSNAQHSDAARSRFRRDSVSASPRAAARAGRSWQSIRRGKPRILRPRQQARLS